MTLDYTACGEWLTGSGPDSDVVVSSRIRLARNLGGYNFVNRSDRDERQQIVDMVHRHRDAISDAPDGLSIINLHDADALERSLLVERHLISKQLAKGRQPRAVVVAPDESMAIMVNEEDHFRMQVIRSGFQLRRAYDQVNELDDRLEQRMHFAFDSRFGYLTACPTNVGTGIRISVMLHLPGLALLSSDIERVRRAARDMHLALRGFYGEGSDALGDFFQLSNQTTFGKTESELLEEFEERIVPQVVSYERHAREELIDRQSTRLDDVCFRALGVLQNARIIKIDEAMRLLSHLRLGISTGRITEINRETINQLTL
ncbi:MAG: ATP--guanido phosphotransferase, partial [Planctomycetota bacterium]